MIEPGHDDIQSSYIRNDSLFFVSSSSGTDNIYLCKPDKSVVPLTRSRFGASDLNLNGYLLLFSDYSSSGNEICYTTLPTGSGNEEIQVSESSYLINRFKPDQNLPNDVSDNVYTPVLTENGRIFSDFTAGCHSMQILKK